MRNDRPILLPQIERRQLSAGDRFIGNEQPTAGIDGAFVQQIFGGPPAEKGLHRVHILFRSGDDQIVAHLEARFAADQRNRVPAVATAEEHVPRLCFLHRPQRFLRAFFIEHLNGAVLQVLGDRILLAQPVRLRVKINAPKGEHDRQHEDARQHAQRIGDGEADDGLGRRRVRVERVVID